MIKATLIDFALITIALADRQALGDICMRLADVPNSPVRWVDLANRALVCDITYAEWRVILSGINRDVVRFHNIMVAHMLFGHMSYEGFAVSAMLSLENRYDEAVAELAKMSIQTA